MGSFAGEIAYFEAALAGWFRHVDASHTKEVRLDAVVIAWLVCVIRGSEAGTSQCRLASRLQGRLINNFDCVRVSHLCAEGPNCGGSRSASEAGCLFDCRAPSRPRLVQSTKFAAARVSLALLTVLGEPGATELAPYT